MDAKFFDLIYYMKKQFGSVNELKNAYVKSEEIEKSNTLKEAKSKFGQYVIQNNILKIDLLGCAIKYYKHNDKGVKPAEQINNYVASVYREIDGINLPNDDIARFDSYRYFLTQMLDSEGRFLNPKYVPKEENADEDEKSEIDNNTVSDFLSEFNVLKSLALEERDLYHLIYFVYATGINKYDYYKIDREKFENDIPNDLQIIVPFLKSMSEEHAIANKMMKSFYRVFVQTDEYDTDTKYIDVIKEANKKAKVIDFDFDRLAEMSRNISSTLKDETTFVDKIDDLIKNPDKFKETFESGDGTALFGNASLTDAIAAYNSGRDAKISSSVENTKKAEEVITRAISKFITDAAEEVSKSERTILDYRKLMTNTFVIKTYKGKRGQSELDDAAGIVITMDDAISKWSAFLKTPMYRTGFGSSLMKDISDNFVNDEFITNNYSDEDFGYIDKDEAKKIINILEVIDASSAEKIASSCEDFLNDNAMLNIQNRFSAAYQMLKWLKLFFEIPFANDVSVDKSKLTGQYYDAACQLVYYKDKNVKESYVPEKSSMLFEKVVLFEAHDWTKYFNSVSDAVMKFFKKVGANDVLKYVANGSLIKPGEGVLPEKKPKAEKKEDKPHDNNDTEKKAEQTVELAKEANASGESQEQAEKASSMVTIIINNGTEETTKEVKTGGKKVTVQTKPAAPAAKKAEPAADTNDDNIEVGSAQFNPGNPETK